jgi:hypothetical protein
MPVKLCLCLCSDVMSVHVVCSVVGRYTWSRWPIEWHIGWAEDMLVQVAVDGTSCCFVYALRCCLVA